MNSEQDSIPTTLATSALGDRIRHLASQLRQEREVQIQATARVLGAAAQIATNHDQLIDQVVDMVETDLDQADQFLVSELYTVDRLKQQFRSLKDAKMHFSVKANSWDALAAKLNQPVAQPVQKPVAASSDITQRLDTIEQELHHLRADVNQVLNLLTVLVKKLS